jgi:molybdate transport system substrate-binding protein
MAEITVMASLAFKAAYLELVPLFEKARGHKVTTLWVPSVDMRARLKGGEVVDMIVMSRQAIEELIPFGAVTQDGITNLATAGVGVAVKAGAKRPDISTPEALKRAVLAAKSVAYSHGPSGAYLVKLFETMGIAKEVDAKLTRVKDEPAGALVARGQAEIGFQQKSELLPVAGIDYIGPLPAEIQNVTTFAAGQHAKAPQPDATKALVKFLTAPAARPIIEKSGMDVP